MASVQSPALVLNASYEPLSVVSLQRAVVLVLSQKASVVEHGDGVLHSERLAFPVPSVVRLSHYVRVPYRRGVPLTRRGVFERDDHRCVYCGGRPQTLDHVVPRSRGGEHVWTNVVTACQRCNHRKADRLLSELGWSLATPPRVPATTVALFSGFAPRQPSWSAWLGQDQVAADAAS